MVLEVKGFNVSTTYITAPANPKQVLGIKLPYLVMIIKNLKKYFSFEVTVLDDRNLRRRFRASNYQVSARSSNRPDHYKSEALHLHHAHETRRGLESDPVQLE